MLIKILLLLVVLYYLYKLFGGKFELTKKSEPKEDKEVDENTLVECSKCGVYITKKEAKILDKEIICTDCAKEL